MFDLKKKVLAACLNFLYQASKNFYLERFDGHVVLERLHDVLLALYIELYIVKALDSSRLIVNRLALDVRDHFALEKARYAALHFGGLHFILQIVHEDATQLLHVMLHESVQSFPAEGARELLGAHRLLAELQIVKNTLQCVGHTFNRVIIVRGHEINGPTQLIGEIESLQERIHVASGALIGQAHVARQFFGVPGGAVRCVRV